MVFFIVSLEKLYIYLTLSLIKEIPDFLLGSCIWSPSKPNKKINLITPSVANSIFQFDNSMQLTVMLLKY